MPTPSLLRGARRATRHQRRLGLARRLHGRRHPPGAPGAACGWAFSLPQLFVWGRLLDGVNEVREMRCLLEDGAGQDPDFVCGACGGVCFVPCPACAGSRKVFVRRKGALAAAATATRTSWNLFVGGPCCYVCLVALLQGGC